MAKLSIAASAVWEAFNQGESERAKLVNALRALADQVVPAEPYYENCDVVRDEIFDIIAELGHELPPAHKIEAHGIG